MREHRGIPKSFMKTFSMGLMLMGLLALSFAAAQAQTPTPSPTPTNTPNQPAATQSKPPAQVVVAPLTPVAESTAPAAGQPNAVTPGMPAEATISTVPECNRIITADVVAIDQIIFFNRFGSFDPGGMMYALKRDTVAVDPQSARGPYNVQFRPDKRPRPLVLRANEGDCLQVTFTNWLVPRNAVDDKVFPVWPANQPYRTPTTPVKLSHNDTPATRNASMHVNGLDYINGPNQDDGAFVGKNDISLAPPSLGFAVTYNWYAGKQGQYLIFSTGASSGGEGDGGQLDHGLFGMINVEPTGSVWYRSQVTAAQMQAAKIGTNPNGTPILDYEKPDANGDPILNILKGNEIIHADLNAIITDPSGTLNENCANAPPSGTCGQPFREFSVIFHDELESGAPAFQELLNPLFHGVRDGFGINYGSSGLGAEVLANRKGLGPAANCPECNYEEFFLESPSNGDPAVLVKYDATGHHAIDGLFQDDPSNVHHSYLLDPVRFRNVHAGPKETHVFHLHQHQWLQSPRDPNSTYLDSQTISPGASFTYEIQYGGGGNRNVGSPGDSIFHCHLYPHFAQGMWELWRNHDTFEDGTVGLNPKGCEQTPGCNPAGKSVYGRNLADGEVATGIQQPALVPIPYLWLKDQNGTKLQKVGNLPMPRADFEGFPFYMENQAGHRSPQAPFGREINPSTNIAYGGLPRHRVVSGTVLTGTAAVPNDQLNDPIAQRVNSRVDSTIAPYTFGFAKKLDTANLQFLAENGTTAEQAAMAHHNGQEPGGTPFVIRQQGVAIPSWTAITYPTFTAWDAQAAIFAVNGRLHQPGAPYSDPCPSTFVDDNQTTRPVPLRHYRTAWIQLDGVINNAGWHDRQMRIAVLEQDVAATLNGTRPTEPLFFRANSGDCIDYRVTNLTRSNLNLDDFQVFQGTDIVGQHIHLVKFDVTSSDGAGNGWNYESGGFSPEAVRERIDAFNKYQMSINSPTRLTATANPSVPNNAEFLGAQTHIERWWADPLVNRNGRDRTLRTVFTHDHFSPSGHQHHGLYAGLVIEPTDAQWKFINGSAMGGPVSSTPLRADGGPTSYAANIIAGPSGQDSFREFMLEIGDFALVYTPAPANIPINPPNHKDFPLPEAIGFPVLLDPSQNPTPESISANDPGTQVINYRNEPLPLRIGQLNQAGQKLVQKPGLPGDLAFAFSSDVHGDPATPLLPSYPNDRVQIRILQGAQEEQHVMNVHGHKWLFEPGTPQDPASVNNSGYTNSQHIGISEHFEFDMSEKTLPLFSDSNTADYLYQSAGTDNLWDGMWGLMRTYAAVRSDVATLPNNQLPPNVPASPFRGSICPSNPQVPPKDFFVQARLASDLAGPRGIVYNDRFNFHDPAGVVYVLQENVAPIQQGTMKLEPLVIRANAGDCVRVHLTNNLPADLPEYNSWNFMPPIAPGFNFNQVKTSNRVSLHSQLLAYDVGSSDGATIGTNPDQTVGPGETKVYTWYAGKIISINPANNTVTVTPIEFGATGLRDYGDVIKHSSHGLIGSLIIEPPNTTWTNDAGTNSSATVKDANNNPLFREFVVQYQSDVTMQNAAGTSRFVNENGVTTDTFTNSGMNNDRGTDDAEESGMHGFNYRNEPLWARLNLPSDTDLKVLGDQDYTNTLSSTQPNPGCGGPCGDPETPLFQAQAGVAVRFRVVDSADHPRQHGFTVFGHHWQFEPWTDNSRQLGFNPDTFEIGSYSGIGPTRHLNILTTAGGAFLQPGDYLYRTQESFKFSGGLWGIFRVSSSPPPIDGQPPGAPSNLVATLTPGNQAALSWSPSTSGTVDHYQVERAQSVYGPYAPVASTTGTSTTDTTTMSGVAYLYRVRALDAAGNRSNASNADMVTTILFTDNPLIAGVTTIKAVHLTELRQAVDAVRVLSGLTTATWTDPSPAGVIIKAIHIQELRANLDQALSLLSRPMAPYTDPNLTTAIQVLKVHIEELRQRVK